jgi:glycosyltransferase involved in cell wall biosynthesis
MRLSETGRRYKPDDYFLGVTVKILSFAVPCFNSAAYMSRSIESLLPGGEEVEILIIDDCSTDGTFAIARQYEEQYPGIVRAIHRECNGGHGAAVMTGLENAGGIYFKVVDSDDWVNREAYEEILSLLQTVKDPGRELDMVLSNFVYEKQGASRKKVMRYKNVIPENKVFTWNDSGHFHTGTYILMHSIIYRTKMLIECGLRLPEHTFYVDNIFAFYPLPYVEKMYYLNVDFYRYFIGRDDQSVQENVMIKRIDQQLRVNYLMVDDYKNALPLIKEKRKLIKYMYDYLEIITSVSTIMLILSGSEEALKKKRLLWKYIKETDIYTWRKMRARFMGFMMNLHGKLGRLLCIGCYRFAQKVYGFN